MKRIISLLLSAIMVIAIIPVSVFMVAAEGTTSTLDFSTTDYRESQDANQQSWHSTDGVVTFINEKASSSTPVANYCAPVRCYANSSITIVCSGITKIVFNCNKASYATTLGNSITGATVSDKVVTVELATATDSYKIDKLSGQVRIDSIVVTYTGAVCEHANANEANCTEPSICPDCGKTIADALGHNYVDGTCTECGDVQHVCSEWTDGSCTEDSVCVECGEVKTPAPGHNFVDGVCTECGEDQPTSATIDFATTNDRTSLDSNQQEWKVNGFVFKNIKTSDSSAIIDTSNPVRLYKNSIITIDFAGMTKIVFNCDTAAYASDLADSITGATVTTEDKVVTVVLDEAANSFEITLSVGQVRLDSVTVYAEAGEPTPDPDPTPVEAGKVEVTGHQKTDAVDGVYTVRFIAAVGELVAGQEMVGFVINATEHGKSWDKTTKTVYTSLTANYGTDVVTADEVGGAYITAMAITGVPEELGAVTFEVTPYTIVNGTPVYGETVTITVNQ